MPDHCNGNQRMAQGDRSPLTIPWATMKCRLCDSDRLSLAYTQGNEAQYRFYRCQDCCLVNYDLATGTDQAKYAHPDSTASDDTARSNRGSSASYRYLSRRVSTTGKLLDIGCGNGRILYLATRDGWDARGLELDRDLAEFAAVETGCQVTTMDFLDSAATIEGAPFDVVILRHVLEHLRDTRLALGRIRSLLTVGGIALLEFPNIDGLDLRLKRWLEARGVRRKTYGTDYVPGHCNEFSRSSFDFAAKVCGLQIVDWQTYSHRPLVNLGFGRLGLGNKARVIVERGPEDPGVGG